MNRLKIARAYLERGWSFYPTYPRSKAPFLELCPRWTPFRDELPSERDVETWFGIAPTANLALITGPLSQLCIVDCDSESAISAFCDLCDVQVLADFETPLVRSRRGVHLYFKRPGASDVRASQKRIFEAFGIADLELKADLGCCTAPPSVHESGHEYRFEMSPHRYQLAPLPAPLAGLAQKIALSTHEPVVVSQKRDFLCKSGSAYGRVALRNTLDKLAGTRDHRNDALNDVALAMGRLVASGTLDEFTVRAALCEVALSIGLEAKEVFGTFNSGFKRGLAEPRFVPERAPMSRSRSQSRGGAFV